VSPVDVKGQMLKQSIQNAGEVANYIKYAFGQAHIAQTAKNPRSSRGHTLYFYFSISAWNFSFFQSHYFLIFGDFFSFFQIRE
jgi:hypothetical protein